MINFHERFEDMDEYELQGELSQLLWKDNVNQFLTLLNYLYRRGEGGNDVQFDRALDQILAFACRTGAVKCVATLINGKGPLVVDIHSPCYKSFYPLHYAAESGHPGVTELLLNHGARTDARCDRSDITDHTINSYHITKRKESDHPCNLPLHVALNQFWCCIHFEEWGHLWKRDRCIAHLLISLSLPFVRNLLETVGLLAWKTEAIKEEFLHFAKNGQVLEFAILLVVARKKLLDSAAAVVELVGYLTRSNALVKNVNKRVMLDLLDVFDRAGDEIEAYVKKDKLEEPLQIVSEVICLLQQAGFHVNSQDSLILYFQRSEYHKIYAFDRKSLYTQKVADIGVPHYSTSRWALSKEPEPEPERGHYKFKVPNISTEKKLSNSWIPFRFTSSHDLKVSAALYHTGLEAKLKWFGFNSLSILSSKPWAMFGRVFKWIVGR